MNFKFAQFLTITFLIITALLYLGCSEESESPFDTNGGDENETGSGFGSMKVGSWAEYESGDLRMRLEFIGTDTYNGTECYILETEYPGQNLQRVFQLWMNKNSGETVLFVMKEGKTVIKMQPVMASGYVPKDAGEIPSAAKKLADKDYTTPTGKKVKAVAYEIKTSSGTSEKWISKDVPFNAVKLVSVNGEVTLLLYDFGTSGAKRDISKEEAEKAQTFGQPI